MHDAQKGLLLTVYRGAEGGDCSLNGVSKRFTRLYLVGYVDGRTVRGGVEIKPLPRISQVFTPKDPEQRVVMVPPHLDGALPHLVPLSDVASGRWTMYGGNQAGTGDSRFGDLIRNVFDGPLCVGTLPVHDRIEGR